MHDATWVLDRARSAMMPAILYWAGAGGTDPGASSPATLLPVAQAWAGLDPQDQQDLLPIATALGIDVHDPGVHRPACDCSGYVCWALGMPRVAPGSGNWTNTDRIWEDAMGPQTRFCRLTAAVPGAIVVYPKMYSDERYGHVAIVVEADDQGNATLIAHCSATNFKTEPYNAIKLTGPDKFTPPQRHSVYAWCRAIAK